MLNNVRGSRIFKMGYFSLRMTPHFYLLTTLKTVNSRKVSTMWCQLGFSTHSGFNGLNFDSTSPGLCSQEPLVFSVLTKGQ